MSSSDSTIRTAQLVVPLRPQYFASIRQLVLDFTQDTALSKDDAQDLCLAVMEAATNAIKYSKSGCLTVTLNESSRAITVKISDQGCGFKLSPDRYNYPGLEAQSGRGIPLMSSLTDSLEINSRPGQGTEVTLVKRVGNKNKRLMKAQMSG